jgi:hypothetical protein
VSAPADGCGHVGYSMLRDRLSAER